MSGLAVVVRASQRVAVVLPWWLALPLLVLLLPALVVAGAVLVVSVALRVAASVLAPRPRRR